MGRYLYSNLTLNTFKTYIFERKLKEYYLIVYLRSI